ncbi:S-methyl-5'-thioinosine phosphorylase [Parvibium lacunae]|uniref:Probable 6-oxopurine nucleoside phosphorylase n=1 Tax=Parvibium lacunae TaxID=1888893 RepID=A0A368L7H5_9BURK|nr:S-methyl-5'-thioinosine phosphorylase [Parvibium lacunae]RCS59567.1 S-methyl-5'-thioinosine phosphorylase [Parvibium lacunae]
MFAIIGGSGLAKLTNLEVSKRQVMRTPYGEPSGALTFGQINGVDVVFFARHGYGHTIAPHEINYRANLWALHALDVDGIISIASVGGIRQDMQPGTLVIPDQIIDYTFGRKHTFFEGPEQPVNHIDFTQPYSEELRAHLFAAVDGVSEACVLGATYACTQGPRLETAAEIRRLERDGADIVGMTGMPEAALARELGLKYATLAIVANWAAGKGDSRETVSKEGIQQTLEQAMHRVRKILVAFVAQPVSVD